MSDLPGLHGRGRRYREILDQVDIRIAVSGTRWKSTVTRRLHDVFSDRGYDTFAKVTGEHPVTIHNGVERPVERRGAQTTLYENRHLITEAVERVAAAGFDVPNVAVFENHAITEYTMRMFNGTFFRPHVVVLLNVRTDHTETLGRTRQDIARSFARSVPAGTHVVSGERNDAIHEYLAAELRARDATVTRVDVPAEYRDRSGAAAAFAVNAVLEAFDEPTLSDSELVEALERRQPEWWRFADGSRAFPAAKLNDVESTELVRHLLAGSGPDADPVCPFVFLRGDRRGRTASFVPYLDHLYERDLVDRAHVAGANARTFARRTAVPVTVHDAERTSPGAVLDALLAEGQPVLTMANAVHPFMEAFDAEMQDRVVETTVEAMAPTHR